MVLGPVSSASSSGSGPDTFWGCFLVVCILGVVFVQYYRSRRRVWALRTAALQRGWAWTDSDVYWEVPIRDLINVSAADLRIEHAFEGTQNGLRFAACDCVVGSGRYKTYLSLIAVRASNNPFGAERWTSEVSVSQSGEWFGAIRTARSGWAGYRLFTAPEIFALIESIG